MGSLRSSTNQITKDASAEAVHSAARAFTYYCVFSREVVSIVAARRSIS